MRKVHWAVWGCAGFFSVMLLGLWVDSRWLIGVGVTLPPRSSSTTAPIRQVQAIVSAPREEAEPDAAGPLDAEATIPSAGKHVTASLSAPGVLGRLEIPE